MSHAAPPSPADLSREFDEEVASPGVKGMGELTAVSVGPPFMRSSTDHESQYLESAHKRLCGAVTFRRRTALVPRDSCSTRLLDLAAICRRLSLSWPAHKASRLHRSDSVLILALCVQCGVAIEMNSAQPITGGHSDWIDPIVPAFDLLSARKQDINEPIATGRGPIFSSHWGYLCQIYGNAARLVGYAAGPGGSTNKITSVTIPYNNPQGLAGF